MNYRYSAFAGAALLAFGLFTPIVTIPLVGTVNLFGNGTNPVAIAILALAALAVGLAAKDRLPDVKWPGLAASGALIYSFGRLQYGLVELQRSLAELQGNPFSGLAQGAASTVQLQWGWIVLAVGAGLLVYVGLSTRGTETRPFPAFIDSNSRKIAGVCVIALLAVGGIDLLRSLSAKPSGSAEASGASPSGASAVVETVTGPSQEEAAYIRNSLVLYDLTAKYQDSMLEGRVPGVDFKIKNNGNRTLNGVEVKVVFYDENGKPISEEEFHPVLVSAYNYGGDNTPLRPNYIWQQERGQFYAAKNVPSEWKAGKATATITDIEFAPNE